MGGIRKEFVIAFSSLLTLGFGSDYFVVPHQCHNQLFNISTLMNSCYKSFCEPYDEESLKDQSSVVYLRVSFLSMVPHGYKALATLYSTGNWCQVYLVAEILNFLGWNWYYRNGFTFYRYMDVWATRCWGTPCNSLLELNMDSGLSLTHMSSQIFSIF